MYVSIQKAVELTGKSRATLSRYIKSGKLSKTDKGIDTSEILRVFGEMKQNNDASISNNKSSSLSEHERWLMKQIEQLQHDIKELKFESLEREKRLMALLENQQHVNRENSAGLFSKLFR